MTDQLQSDLRRFVGMNIKGTPAMSADAVGHDIEVAKANASIVVTQETRWRWYWRRFRKVLTGGRDRDRWRSTPGFVRAIAKPVRAGQAVLHKGRHWRRIDHRVEVLHDGERKISENRYIRGVTLADRKTDLAVEAITTHNVVRGDEHDDPARRQQILDGDLDVLDHFLSVGRLAGRAMILQLDANIRKGSGASYRRLLRIFEKHGGTIHGAHGVEWLVTFDGDDVAIDVTRTWVIPARRLRTDHEARGITFRLVAKRRRGPARR